MTYQRFAHPAPATRQTVKHQLSRALERPEIIGLNRREVRYLHAAIDAIPAEKLLDGSGIYFKHQSLIAMELGWSIRTLSRAVAALRDKGLILMKTGRNGRRDGQLGLGVSLRPMVDLLPAILDRIREAITERKQREQKRREMRSEIAEHRHAIFLLISGDLPSAVTSRVQRAAEAWPQRPSSIRDEAALQRHLIQLRAIRLWITRKISTALADPHAKSGEQYTTSEKTFVSKARNLVDRRAMRGSADKNALELKTVATPEMMVYLEAAETYGLRYDQIALTRGAEIGVSRTAIYDAIATLGPMTTLTLIIVIDANMAHPKTPIRNPTAYMASMARGIAGGSVSLLRNLAGIQARRAVEAVM